MQRQNETVATNLHSDFRLLLFSVVDNVLLFFIFSPGCGTGYMASFVGFSGFRGFLLDARPLSEMGATIRVLCSNENRLGLGR
jgi:hypothetical protein